MSALQLHAEADALIQRHGMWGEHPDRPVSDWQYEVACGDTRLGYWEWVAHQMLEH
ncbi:MULTISPECIES: hypothetical protein [Mycolicibacter]|nr:MULTISPECIES: hypothetical protein [Mycolicibacter]